MSLKAHTKADKSNKQKGEKKEKDLVLMLTINQTSMYLNEKSCPNTNLDSHLLQHAYTVETNRMKPTCLKAKFLKPLH